jgi:hypothetical protein
MKNKHQLLSRLPKLIHTQKAFHLIKKKSEFEGDVLHHHLLDLVQVMRLSFTHPKEESLAKQLI